MQPILFLTYTATFISIAIALTALFAEDKGNYKRPLLICGLVLFIAWGYILIPLHGPRMFMGTTKVYESVAYGDPVELSQDQSKALVALMADTKMYRVGHIPSVSRDSVVELSFFNKHYSIINIYLSQENDRYWHINYDGNQYRIKNGQAYLDLLGHDD